MLQKLLWLTGHLISGAAEQGSRPGGGQGAGQFREAEMTIAGGGGAGVEHRLQGKGWRRCLLELGWGGGNRRRCNAFCGRWVPVPVGGWSGNRANGGGGLTEAFGGGCASGGEEVGLGGGDPFRGRVLVGVVTSGGADGLFGGAGLERIAGGGGLEAFAGGGTPVRNQDPEQEAHMDTTLLFSLE
ncbi:hypothetical protein KFL_002240180 [Klebsormidium nitens]|uniref:Uncharacterized protein n=1 Tax=Klebsormidium nitens TaxID=105231 RepID=A0A1Y1I936_KLENI|nr:hypothetical protein KFL_002240180 [Klebsormidium nitens]|eukprot:GAQ85217.1 hypothetical protein KFL_002240180 [Klebsormidium nitens]